jgi:hypothetical protein
VSKQTISIQIPTNLDAFFEREAKQRMTSKSAVIREVLAEHVSKKMMRRPAVRRQFA